MWRKIVFNHPLLVVLLAVGVAGLDFLTGPLIIFPILDVVPVTLAAWNRRRVLAVLVSLFLTAAHIWFGRGRSIHGSVRVRALGFGARAHRTAAEAAALPPIPTAWFRLRMLGFRGNRCRT